MEERFTIQKLLVVRKITRAVVELVRGQLKSYLTALAPLTRPRNLLGEYVRGTAKETVKGSENALRDLKSIYEPVAATKLYDLPKELNPPLELSGSLLDFHPLDYAHAAKTERESKAITVTSPLKWVLSYSGIGPRQLKDLLATRAARTGDELQQSVLHFCVLHQFLNVAKHTGLTELFAGLRFTVSSGKVPEFGELPITFLTSAVPTILPPDEVIIESTEISGSPVFEEVVDIQGIVNLSDPLRDRLIEIVKLHDASLLAT